LRVFILSFGRLAGMIADMGRLTGGRDSASRERPISFAAEMVRAIQSGAKTQTRRPVQPAPGIVQHVDGELVPWLDGKVMGCKFGKPADRLWVRERFASAGEKGNQEFTYAADFTGNGRPRWQPSYVMPRSACRIMLEIMKVRIERLTAITAADARAEGLSSQQNGDDPIAWFHTLWDSLAIEPNRWADNPWVWVIDFKLIQP
jgi:hypothetical protein